MWRLTRDNNWVDTTPPSSEENESSESGGTSSGGSDSGSDSDTTVDMTETNEKLDSLVNGYENEDANANNDELSNNLDEMQGVENTLTNDAFEGMNEYTITDDIMNYSGQFAVAFPLVASMIQSVFDSSGEFSILVSVIFTVAIASMLIGLFRFYKD